MDSEYGNLSAMVFHGRRYRFDYISTDNNIDDINVDDGDDDEGDASFDNRLLPEYRVLGGGLDNSI